MNFDFDVKNKLQKHETSMRDRFILRVLMPPFLMMIIIGGLALWQLSGYFERQAIEDLNSAADTTAIRLERELAIRETVLKNTGEEISVIKNTYDSEITVLEESRKKCREHYLENYTFNNSPNSACDTFSTSGRYSLNVIEDEFISQATEAQAEEIKNINQRLTAYSQFFPETLAIMVMGKNDNVVSSAISNDSNLKANDFTNYAVRALESSVDGEIITIQNVKLAIFGYPTSDGSVLAAYDVRDPSFIRPSWQSTPIDTSQALAYIVEKDNNVVFPTLVNESEVLEKSANVKGGDYYVTKIDGVSNIITAELIANTDWKILVASPEDIVLSPIKDARFTAIVLLGTLVVGFLWVGALFIKKTTDNLAKLVTAAVVYSSGRLDYKFNVNTTEKEFRQLADTMHYMAEKIAKNEKEIDERNKEFISVATHELRAPMTSIIGYLSMLKENIEKKLNKGDKMLLDQVYEGTIRLRDLVNDMLDAARLEGGREEFNFQSIDIKKLINETLENMQVVAKENKVKISYDSKHATEVYADEAKLRIILNNFLSNAIKYNHKNGHVKVTHALHKNELVTTVANSGPTIPEDQKAHMFEKFFRVDTAEHRKVKGTGIGMHVTKQYIEAMKGKLSFESEKGKDNVFYFSIPTSASRPNSTTPMKVTPQAKTDSKWIMRWRKRLK